MDNIENKIKEAALNLDKQLLQNIKKDILGMRKQTCDNINIVCKKWDIASILNIPEEKYKNQYQSELSALKTYDDLISKINKIFSIL